MSCVIASPKLVVGFTLACSFATRCLTSSKEGWKTVEVFVLYSPCFSCLRWPFDVAIEGRRCFWMSGLFKPGHVVKWLLFIALMKVDLTGLKHAAWRNLARSSFVCCLRMMTFNRCLSRRSCFNYPLISDSHSFKAMLPSISWNSVVKEGGLEGEGDRKDGLVKTCVEYTLLG